MPVSYYEIFGFKTYELPDGYEEKFRKARLAWDPDKVLRGIEARIHRAREQGIENLQEELTRIKNSAMNACDAEIYRIFNEKDEKKLNESLKQVDSYNSILRIKCAAIF